MTCHAVPLACELRSVSGAFTAVELTYEGEAFTAAGLPYPLLAPARCFPLKHNPHMLCP